MITVVLIHVTISGCIGATQPQLLISPDSPEADDTVSLKIRGASQAVLWTVSFQPNGGQVSAGASPEVTVEKLGTDQVLIAYGAAVSSTSDLVELLDRRSASSLAVVSGGNGALDVSPDRPSPSETLLIRMPWPDEPAAGNVTVAVGYLARAAAAAGSQTVPMKHDPQADVYTARFDPRDLFPSRFHREQIKTGDPLFVDVLVAHDNDATASLYHRAFSFQ